MFYANILKICHLYYITEWGVSLAFRKPNLTELHFFSFSFSGKSTNHEICYRLLLNLIKWYNVQHQFIYQSFTNMTCPGLFLWKLLKLRTFLVPKDPWSKLRTFPGNKHCARTPGGMYFCYQTDFQIVIPYVMRIIWKLCCFTFDPIATVPCSCMYWSCEQTEGTCSSCKHITELKTHTVKFLIWDAPNSKTQMFLILACHCLCAIYWSQVLSGEWRCSWSSADRRCTNYIWVINNLSSY